MSARERRALTYGTFDLFHYGHVRLLRRLSEMGNMLVVGLSTDAFNDIKGKKAVMTYAQRREVLEACRYVDLITPENDRAQKPRDIVTHGVTLFAMGDGWAGKFDDLRGLTEVRYLSRTPEISTTEVKGWVTSEPRVNLT